MTLELAIALLWVGANALIIGYAYQSQSGLLAVAFYAVWFTGVLVLPNGGAQWFWLAVFTAVAVQCGRHLVAMQERAKADR